MATDRRIEFGGIAVSTPDSWQDISDQSETSDAVFTLARDDGQGALQFSMAFYERGPIPNPSVADLTRMVQRFGEQRQLGEGFDSQEQDGACRIAATSYRWEDRFLRVWYVSDGRNFAFISYNADWGAQDGELPDCEEIVRSVRFVER